MKTLLNIIKAALINVKGIYQVYLEKNTPCLEEFKQTLNIF